MDFNDVGCVPGKLQKTKQAEQLKAMPISPVAVLRELYREEIEKRTHNFSVITFAIYSAGYGPDNYTPFQRVFSDQLRLG